MRQVFADSNYWIALVNPRDHLHAKAVTVTQRISPATIWTSELVLVELLNSFSGVTPLRHQVGRLVQQLRGNPEVVIVAQTSAQFASALRRYQLAADKGWSLTDCASFEVMETERIQSVLTHDQHFAQAGFETLLRKVSQPSLGCRSFSSDIKPAHPQLSF